MKCLSIWVFFFFQMFEFWAGLGSDKYPFGLGDMCILQPRGTILITYLTSDVLRGFPWRQVSPAFVSQPLGSTLCSITQLTTEIVAVTSSNSDQLSFVKVILLDYFMQRASEYSTSCFFSIFILRYFILC